MSHLLYIDNEVPTFGEWDSTVTFGLGSITRAAAASFPERGSYGLKVTGDSGDTAYAISPTVPYTLAPGAEVFVGLWFRRDADWDNYVQFGRLYLGGTEVAHWYVKGNGELHFRILNNAGAAYGTGWVSGFLVKDRWVYLVFRLKRSESGMSNGQGWVYIDGVLAGTTSSAVDNYTRCAGSGAVIYAGEVFNTRDGTEFSLDEIKLDETYPQPHAAAPADDLPCPERTAVLWRAASADSREFADYCATQLGVPRANLIRLDNASSSETLASYATFQSEVENAIDDFFALNTQVADRCTCFLVGKGVPGYFTHSGTKHSAASRLMNYGTAFSSGTANPHYQPSPVQRLTQTALAGQYLACRIDAASLTEAKWLINRAGSAPLAVAEAGKLYSDESAYLGSLPCQRLRMPTAALGTLNNDAFTWGDTGTPDFGLSPGSRITFTDDSADSASSLRSGSCACLLALFGYGYTAALGTAGTPDAFDIESFMEMLRIGGTLAEAVMAAVAKLDYTAVPAGSPLLQVSFQLAGYNVYRGIGGPDSIDYAAPVAYVRAGVGAAELVGQGHEPDVHYHYGVRAVSSSGVEEANTDRTCRVIVDDEGNVIGKPPNRIAWADAQPAAGGKVRVTCFYSNYRAEGAAVGIQVAPIVADEPDWEALVQTLPIAGTRRLDVILNPTYSHGEVVRLALRAVTADAATGPAYRLDPVTADAEGPPAVDYLKAGQVGT